MRRLLVIEEEETINKAKVIPASVKATSLVMEYPSGGGGNTNNDASRRTSRNIGGSYSRQPLPSQASLQQHGLSFAQQQLLQQQAQAQQSLWNQQHVQAQHQAILAQQRAQANPQVLPPAYGAQSQTQYDSQSIMAAATASSILDRASSQAAPTDYQHQLSLHQQAQQQELIRQATAAPYGAAAGYPSVSLAQPFYQIQQQVQLEQGYQSQQRPLGPMPPAAQSLPPSQPSAPSRHNQQLLRQAAVAAQSLEPSSSGIAGPAATAAPPSYAGASNLNPSGRLPSQRPVVKLSVALIDTYKRINTVYYEERDARRASRARERAQQQAQQAQQQAQLQQQQAQQQQDYLMAQSQQLVAQQQAQLQQQQAAAAAAAAAATAAAAAATAPGTGTNNNGWDDENFDYIINIGELFYGRYKIKERIGKGSFGQVVRALDVETQNEVAIKIIKSKKPFLMQAKTEIELLLHLNTRDPDDQHNIVRLLKHFMHRNHQCLVFEMLSLNLYELLKNTQFGGVSLNLIRKFAKQVLKSLHFLSQNDVDIIHCDLKPENILLRHPKKSGIKVIDFGSSCRSNKRMYSYIQSRFYRSPEVMLGLPYSIAIDMWSLGCILAEMHTGEPLFSGTDQFDQMQKIVKLLGMVPDHMLNQSSAQHRGQFFERVLSISGREEWTIRQQSATGQRSQAAAGELLIPSRNPIASLTNVIRAETTRKKKYPPSETGNTSRNYELFVDLIYRMLAYDPANRIKPVEAMNHPFLSSNPSTEATAAASAPSPSYQAYPPRR